MHVSKLGQRGWALWLLLLVIARWGGDPHDGAGARRRGGMQAARASQALPPALRAAYLAAVQAEGGAGYAVREGEGGLVAENPAQGLRLSFSDEGVAFAEDGASRATLRPARFGCAGALREVGPGRPRARGEGRVEFPREGFVEWYVNGPLGLEQGFSVAEPPSCGDTKSADGEALVVELALGEGLSAALEEGGEQLALRDSDGHRVLGISELYAIDATGKALPARLGVSDTNGVSMRVETAGAVYPVVIDPMVWKEQQKLLASDGGAGDGFGISVALSGDTALVGAYFNNAKGVKAGAAYVFVRSGSSWAQQQQLLASDGATGDGFGDSVALSGDTALIGAPYSDTKGVNAGAAYVFVRSGSSWTEQDKLLASDGAAIDKFGTSVALSGDTALVGAFANAAKGQAAGAAYVFVRSGSSWTQQQQLLASDGAATDNFGTSVALSGDTALVGAPQNQMNGAAYVFVRSGSSWTQQQQLLASDGAANAYFGTSVALSGDTALVGAFGNAAKGQAAGAAYVFVRSGSSWTQQQQLLASDGMANAYFGTSVTLSADTALVGALVRPNAGAAYVFVRSGSSWTQQDELLASDGAADDSFGTSVALSGDTVLVGAVSNDAKGQDAGAAYAFVLPGPGTLCSKDADCPAPPLQGCAFALCRPDTNTCGTRPKLDGAPCPGGICIAGGCLANTPSSMSTTTSASSVSSVGGATSATSTDAATSVGSTGAGNATATTASGAGGAGGAGGAPPEPAALLLHGGACAFETPTSPGREAIGLLAPLLFALRPLRRRPRP